MVCLLQYILRVHCYGVIVRPTKLGTHVTSITHVPIRSWCLLPYDNPHTGICLPKIFSVVDILINVVLVSQLLHSFALGAITTAIDMTAGVLELLTPLLHSHSTAS